MAIAIGQFQLISVSMAIECELFATDFVSMAHEHETKLAKFVSMAAEHETFLVDSGLDSREVPPECRVFARDVERHGEGDAVPRGNGEGVDAVALIGELDARQVVEM